MNNVLKLQFLIGDYISFFDIIIHSYLMKELPPLFILYWSNEQVVSDILKNFYTNFIENNHKQ